MQSAKPHIPGWVTFTGLAVVHLGALCAFIPGTFHWSALVVMVALYYVTGAWGITLGYHRLLTHRSLKVVKPVEYLAAILGTLALQGGPIEWISTHRAHHAHTDKEGDPHDINRGLLWSHFEWLYRPNEARLSPAEQARLAPDLAGDRFYQFLEKTYLLWTIVLGVALLALGGVSWLVWGVFVRIVLTYHITWLVNSAAHHSGYQSFRTGDKSTNNWWVAILAWGEGWHNNHHAFPFSARHGLRWFEFDATWWTIKVLAWLKLARDIKLPTPAMLQRLKLETQRFPVREQA
ncbi:acyl-CoA desaturase [Vulcanimicrobium alpinum]|uniref:Acyl-CoA desaturase n=1 Tax=Vulcanimicrobium alpinum TaxID=3016050 RepID=A0AAN2C8L0_UNVUL|nr:fatty acid desaturase [Vulcanimicrobium alpinum]BDE05068.1 acyl-CoA desaturase [Vulcanimicrobium alpinum]